MEKSFKSFLKVERDAPALVVLGSLFHQRDIHTETQKTYIFLKMPDIFIPLMLEYTNYWQTAQTLQIYKCVLICLHKYYLHQRFVV